MQITACRIAGYFKQKRGEFTASPWSSWPITTAKVIVAELAVVVTLLGLVAAIGNPVGDSGKVHAQAATTAPNPPTSGFNRPIISLAFDDGWKLIHTHGLPLLQQYGMPSTQYINSEPIQGAETGGWTGYMNYNDIRDFAAAGHEIAWHTRTHADLTAPTTNVDEELTVPADFLAGLMTVNISKNLAAPYGTYSDASIAAAKAHGFVSYRSTDEGYNGKTTVADAPDGTGSAAGADGADSVVALNTDNIRVKNITNTTTPADVAAWVRRAAETRTWLVIVYHEIYNEAVPSEIPADPTYAVSRGNLTAELETIRQSSVPVMTVQGALAELLPQL